MVQSYNVCMLNEDVHKFVQDCFAANPVIILGSGHSAAFGIPDIYQLGEYLIDSVSPLVKEEDREEWSKFVDILSKNNLELALSEVQLSQHITTLLVEKTWDHICLYDKKALDQIIKSLPSVFPLARLYTYLFNSTHARLSLITTNYDHMAEYAADIAGHGWNTGFDYGYIGRCSGTPRITVHKDKLPFRMVDIWKVHGSIKWFRREDGLVYNFPSIDALPEGFLPSIVTPGVNKYKETHGEPFRSILTGADLAIEDGKSFFCVGYGFNDDHIQPKLLVKCRQAQKKIVVLAKKLTDATKKVLLDGGCKNFIAFEEAPGGTRVFNYENCNGVILKEVRFWEIGNLLDHVL